jgi:hypothetical protein
LDLACGNFKVDLQAEDGVIHVVLGVKHVAGATLLHLRQRPLELDAQHVGHAGHHRIEQDVADLGQGFLLHLAELGQRHVAAHHQLHQLQAFLHGEHKQRVGVDRSRKRLAHGADAIGALGLQLLGNLALGEFLHLGRAQLHLFAGQLAQRQGGLPHAVVEHFGQRIQFQRRKLHDLPRK